MLTTRINIELYKDAKKKQRLYYVDNNNKYQKHNEFIRFIENYTNIWFYGFKENDLNSLQIISSLLEGVKEKRKKPKKEPVLLENKLKFLINKSPYQLFFINSKDENIIKSYHNVIIANIDNYIKVFSKYSFDDVVYRTGQSKSLKKFIDWNKTLPNMPVSEIIINDNYLLANCEVNNKIYKINNNAFHLFRVINDKYKHLKRIIIFSYCNQRDMNISEKDNLYLNCRNKIKTCFNNNIEVHFIPDKQEHDRHIFSNYFYFQTPSLNCFFDEKGEIIKNGKTSSIKLFSYLNSNNHEIAKNILIDFKIKFIDFKNKVKRNTFIKSELLED